MATKKVFSDYVGDMERRTNRVAGFVIIGPRANRPNDGVGYVGKVQFAYPADGMGRLHVVAWLPDDGSDEYMRSRFYGSCCGCGYDKATSAMGGAEFYSAKESRWVRLEDSGRDWKRQIADHSYEVIQAV